MEKPAINFSLRTLISKFRRSHDESIDPGTIWRATLWTALILILAVGGFAYSTYSWAVSVEAPTAVSRGARDQFSLTELREVIARYHQKEVNFETFFIWNPDVFTFRLLGFGLFACNKNALPLISREKP